MQPTPVKYYVFHFKVNKVEKPSDQFFGLIVMSH
jgi:hypothetical protein